jgi:hypothetical protein
MGLYTKAKREFLKMGKISNLFANAGKMNTGPKGVLLIVGTYIVTMGVTVFIALLAIMFLMMEAHSCNTMSQALVTLWVTIAVVFLVSTIVVGVVTWKIVAGIAGRLAIMAVYGVMMLASYVVFAFGLMVAFNC